MSSLSFAESYAYGPKCADTQVRMTYLPGESKVIYCSKDGKQEKVFDALEWFAAMGSHVPNKGKQMVRPLYFNR
ncbi:MAG: hypothetical protein MUP27_11550 [Desulfobacterales bacterium]|nr:hypothetical protein [Desulfobacterales bacterium]